MASSMSLLIVGVETFYGCIVLATALAYSCLQKEFWYARTQKEELALAEASRELWSLSDDNDAISHNFITTRSGTQMHYLASKSTPKDSATLIIFLHGFPDTAYLFSRQLRSAWSERVQLVALDLPGCGGSDSLPSYGANEVLNVIVESIDQLKDRFSKSNTSKPRCILVGHDWGGVIGFRLAAETRGLIDELVTLNSIYPRYAAKVLKAQVARSGSLISCGKFQTALHELRPVLSQIRRSGYTYMLTLPIPLAKLMPSLSRCLLKLTHSLEYNQSLEKSPSALARRLALAYGPSSLECAQESKTRYGSTVLARSHTSPPGDWDQRVRLYSDGLLRGKWSSPFLASQDDDAWRFHCPVSIVFGLRDIALDPCVVLDGIEDHFMSESDDPLISSTMAEGRITRLPNCGHWSVLEDEGTKALDRVLACIID